MLRHYCQTVERVKVPDTKGHEIIQTSLQMNSYIPDDPLGSHTHVWATGHANGVAHSDMHHLAVDFVTDSCQEVAK